MNCLGRVQGSGFRAYGGESNVKEHGTQEMQSGFP